MAGGHIDGFTITGNVGGMPTAFMAEWTQGEGGPVIGFLGEYDALPGLSQKIQDTQEPMDAGGAGHGCGHRDRAGARRNGYAIMTSETMTNTGALTSSAIRPPRKWSGSR